MTITNDIAVVRRVTKAWYRTYRTDINPNLAAAANEPNAALDRIEREAKGTYARWQFAEGEITHLTKRLANFQRYREEVHPRIDDLTARLAEAERFIREWMVDADPDIVAEALASREQEDR